MIGPLFSYAGSKARLARWHVTLFPETDRYVSVFGGLASEFLHRRATGIEVWNDLDSDLHNMFAVIRESKGCEALKHLLSWTPDGRRQFAECKQMLDHADPVRRVGVPGGRCHQRHAETMSAGGPGSTRSPTRYLAGATGLVETPLAAREARMPAVAGNR